jgi:hypothetical protein
MRKGYPFIILGALLICGCLVSETTHTFYIEPDGSVTWTVLEKDVRSTEKDKDERSREEEAYISSARLEDHPVARAFELLDPFSLESHVLRQERPYTVFTTARFESLEVLSRNLLEALQVTGGTADVGTKDGLHHFVLTLPREVDGEENEDEESPLLALAEDLENYHIVLTNGRFVDAVGFELENDGTMAVPVEIDHDGTGADLIYSLTWTSGT